MFLKTQADDFSFLFFFLRSGQEMHLSGHFWSKRNNWCYTKSESSTIPKSRM